MSNIAIIPARSGSKGLRHKNIRLLNNLPLMAYSIIAAKESGLFDEILVSTDSMDYARIAITYGASVPCPRSAEASTDLASSWDVVTEVLTKLRDFGSSFDTFALLQPTSPLRKCQDLQKAYDMFVERGANAIVGVCEATHSPLWCNTLPDDLSLKGFLPENIVRLPRQSLSKYYTINGSLYIVRTDYFLANSDIYREKAYAFIMPKERSIDIDDELDFIIAEAILRKFM